MSKATPAVCAARAPAASALLRLAVCAAPLMLVAGCAAFPTLTTTVAESEPTFRPAGTDSPVVTAWTRNPIDTR